MPSIGKLKYHLFLKMLSKFTLFAVLASVSCTPVKEHGITENLVGAVSECMDVYTSLCLKVINGLQSVK